MRKLLLFFPAILLVYSTAFAADKPYYYFQGNKQVLEPTNVIAVRLSDGIDIRIVTTDLLLYGLSTKSIEEQRLWLFEFSYSIDVDNLAKRVSSHPAVQFATPVYSKGAEQLVITDELMVKEKNYPDSLTDIVEFARAHSLILARYGPLQNTRIWKVSRQTHLNALEMANVFVYEGLAEYAQPNFLRINFSMKP